MKRNFKLILFIIPLINSLFLCCNNKPPEAIASPNNIAAETSFTAALVSDTLPLIRNKFFTDVHCMLLINYPKISYGEYVYNKYFIKTGKFEFRVDREYRNGENNSRIIPFTKEEKVNKQNTIESDTEMFEQLKFISAGFEAKHYFSTKETYTVNDTGYIVYKHIDFNCYDPLCSSKHGHIAHSTGVTFFSPVYGILISKDFQNMQFELLKSIKECEVPYDLIIDIMKHNKMDEQIIDTYIRKTNRMNSEGNK